MINDKDLNMDADFNIGIGVKELEKLKPAMVKIMDLKIEVKGENNSKILSCSVKHPKSEKEIRISGVELIDLEKKKVNTIGLWLNKDEDGKIRKGCALARFLLFNKANNVSELIGKELMTTLDGSYLVFKGY